MPPEDSSILAGTASAVLSVQNCAIRRRDRRPLNIVSAAEWARVLLPDALTSNVYASPQLAGDHAYFIF